MVRLSEGRAKRPRWPTTRRSRGARFRSALRLGRETRRAARPYSFGRTSRNRSKAVLESGACPHGWRLRRDPVPVRPFGVSPVGEPVRWGGAARRAARPYITGARRPKPKAENRKPKTENRKPKTENRKPKKRSVEITQTRACMHQRCRTTLTRKESRPYSYAA